MAIATQAAIAAWYIQHMATLRQQVSTAQQQAYNAQGDYSDDAADAYVAAIVPVMAGAQAAAAQLTAAYLAYMMTDLAGKTVGSLASKAVDLSRVTGPALRNGVPAEVLYRRPFQQVWTEIARGERKAVDDARERATEIHSGPPPVPSGAASQAASSNAVSRDAAAGSSATREPAASVSHSQGAEPTQDERPSPSPDQVDDAEPQREEPAEPQTVHEKAVAAGERRAKTIGLTDLQLATTHTAQDVLGANQSVIGYRRVLTGAENCGMCVVASTRLYHKRNLMPIHPACDCVVAPVMAGEDPGRTLNNRTIGADAVPKAFNKHGVAVFDADQTIDLGDLLQDTHDAIAEQFGASYRDAKRIDYRKVITVHQHGETGPTLTVARHKFTKRQVDTNDLRIR